MKSILQRNKYCYVCGSETSLHNHHVFFGTANRKLSDEDGCTVWLCVQHHTGAFGVHNNRALDLRIKRNCQTAWQETFNKTTEDFIRRYGKSYL